METKCKNTILNLLITLFRDNSQHTKYCHAFYVYKAGDI